MTWSTFFVSIRLLCQVDWVDSVFSAVITWWIRCNGFEGMTSSNRLDERSLRIDQGRFQLIDTKASCLNGFEDARGMESKLFNYMDSKSFSLTDSKVRMWGWTRTIGFELMLAQWSRSKAYSDGFEARLVVIDSRQRLDRWIRSKLTSHGFEATYVWWIRPYTTLSIFFWRYLEHTNSDWLETWNVVSSGLAWHVSSIVARSGLGQKSSISMANLWCTIDVHD